MYVLRIYPNIRHGLSGCPARLKRSTKRCSLPTESGVAQANKHKHEAVDSSAPLLMCACVRGSINATPTSRVV